jgi:hypothetical protein
MFCLIGPISCLVLIIYLLSVIYRSVFELEAFTYFLKSLTIKKNYPIEVEVTDTLINRYADI